MKVALCKSHFAGPVSGADETLITYAIKLRQAGHDVHVTLLYKHSNNDRYYERLRRNGVSISYIIERSLAFMLLRGLRTFVSSILLFIFLIPNSTARLRRIWQVLIDLISRRHYRDCKKFFAAAHYDLLHVFTPDTGATLMIRAGHELCIPVLYHEMGTPKYLPALDRYYQRLAKVLPLCTEVAALSPTLATQWLAHFPFLKSVSVLPLITEECESVPLAAIASRRKEIVFGYAGRVELGKGPLVLLDAFSELHKCGVRFHVMVAGTGPALQEVKARVRASGLADCWEFVSPYSGTLGCTTFMQALDVFVLPSFAEGTSKSIIEAMANGLPIVTTSVGGSADILLPDAGVLVPPGDSNQLAQAMQQLASDSQMRMRMGAAARKRYRELFSTEAVLPLLVSTYARITGIAPLETQKESAINHHHPWHLRVEQAQADSLGHATSQAEHATRTGFAKSAPFELIPEVMMVDENPVG
jgi:glycosyltransferase involved in cell wall biosynthesis